MSANVDPMCILELFDQSAKGKFERCSSTAWCNVSPLRVEETPCLSFRKRRNFAHLCRKFKLARKIAMKLESLKAKCSELKTPFRGKKLHPVADLRIEEQILQGNNTPANSRPSSISTTMDQIGAPRRKSADCDGPEKCVPGSGSADLVLSYENKITF
jgi:hypothetical protein